MKPLNFTPELYQYITDVSLREHPILSLLREETATMKLGLMQISPELAQFMQLLIRISKAKNVLEIGTFAGYSALAMALALPNDGHVTTCDRNHEWTKRTDYFWKLAKQEHKITLHLAPALITLNKLLDQGLAGTFDFIFIDADKTNYCNYYELALNLLTPNGLILFDNVLWNGKVIDSSVNDGQTREIRKLNALLQQDQRVNISLLAIDDGLFLVQRK